jgi:hypothetical protein
VALQLSYTSPAWELMQYCVKIRWTWGAEARGRTKHNAVWIALALINIGTPKLFVSGSLRGIIWMIVHVVGDG